MITRITTGGMLRSYQANLTKSTMRVAEAEERSITLRSFDSFAESPAGATQSFKLRSDFSRTNSQLSVTSSTMHKFYSAYDVLDTVVGLIDNETVDSAWTSVLEGISDTSGAGRTALGQQLSQLAESIVQDMNTQYGDYYLFSGADGLEIPFTWEDGELYYRGVPVDAAAPKLEIDEDTDKPSLYDANGDKVEDEADAEYYKTSDGKLIGISEYDQLVEEQKKNLAKLDYMSGETRYVDIGLGLKENGDGKLISSSAFNNALQGINFLGYGSDENGDPNNIVSIISRMGEILSNCDEDSGDWASPEEQAEFQRLADKFAGVASDLKEAHVELSTKSNFLQDNKMRLEEKAYTINLQLFDLETINPALAYTEWTYAKNCYNAALMVGNSVLPPTLMDYLRPRRSASA